MPGEPFLSSRCRTAPRRQRDASTPSRNELARFPDAVLRGVRRATLEVLGSGGRAAHPRKLTRRLLLLRRRCTLAFVRRSAIRGKCPCLHWPHRLRRPWPWATTTGCDG